MGVDGWRDELTSHATLSCEQQTIAATPSRVQVNEYMSSSVSNLGRVRTSADECGRVRTSADELDECGRAGRAGRARTSADECGRVRTSADECGRVRTGADGCGRVRPQLSQKWMRLGKCKKGKPFTQKCTQKAILSSLSCQRRRGRAVVAVRPQPRGH